MVCKKKRGDRLMNKNKFFVIVVLLVAGLFFTVALPLVVAEEEATSQGGCITPGSLSENERVWVYSSFWWAGVALKVENKISEKSFAEKGSQIRIELPICENDGSVSFPIVKAIQAEDGEWIFIPRYRLFISRESGYLLAEGSSGGSCYRLFYRPSEEFQKFFERRVAEQQKRKR